MDAELYLKEKASWPVWHSPTDWPPHGQRVLCVTETKSGVKNFVLGYFMADGINRWVTGMNPNVIAWAELPAFPGE